MITFFYKGVCMFGPEIVAPSLSEQIETGIKVLYVTICHFEPLFVFFIACVAAAAFGHMIVRDSRKAHEIKV